MTTEHDDTGNEENLKVLRQKAERADALEAEVQTLTRNLAVRDSKIDTSKPTYKLFEKAYDGEWTPEALNKAAEEYGLVKSEGPTDTKTPENKPAATPPASDNSDGMEFSDEQLAWLKAQNVIPHDAEALGAAASAAAQMDAAGAGGTNKGVGDLSNEDWKQATDMDTFMAQYSQAGGQVVSEN